MDPLRAPVRLALLVGHDEPTRVRLSVRARLLGLEPRSCLTGARALELSEQQRPIAVIADLDLPGEDGLVALAHIERRWPGVNTVLLSAIPPGPSPQYRERHQVDVVLARRGEWEAATVQAAFPGLEPEGQAAPLWRALEDSDEVLALVDEGALPEAIEALALEHLAATRPAEEVLPALERALARPDAKGPRFETALELARAQGRAGLEVAAQVASAKGAAHVVRARAARWLAERFALTISLPVLTPLAKEAGPLADEVCEALLEAGVEAGTEGQDVLQALAKGPAVPPRVRARAARSLAVALEPREARALLGALAQDPDPGLRDLASQLMAQADDFEVERLFEEAHDPNPGTRMRALFSIAEHLPVARARPLLEEAQADADPRVRRLAFELSFARADGDVGDALARAVAQGPACTQAALLGAMKQGRRGLATVAAIAQAEAAPAGSRRKALRLLGLRFNPEPVIPVLRATLEGSDPELQTAARLAAVQLGRPGLGLLYSTLKSRAAPAVRAACLETLERHAPVDFVQTALRRASRDPDPAVRAVAVKLAARRAGAEIAGLIESAVRAEQQSLLTAAVQGAASVGKAGYLGLARLALTEAVPVPARRAAWEALQAGFTEEEQAAVRTRLEASAAAVLAPPTARTEISPSLTRAAVHSGWDEGAPARTAVPPSRPSGPAVEAWEVADTAPAQPAAAVEPPPAQVPTVPAPPATTAPTPPAERTSPEAAAATVPTPPAEQPTRRMAPAHLPPEAPTLVDKPWGEAIPRGTSSMGRPPPKVEAQPVVAPPAEPPPLPPAPAPAADEGAVTILPSGPAPRRSRPRSKQVSLRRAREALQTALQLGQDGYRGLRTLADSSRIPNEVRVQALRHLAADFAGRPIGQVFERALGSDDPAIQNTALSCAMLQREVALRPLAELVARSDAEAATRVRALRFISSRYPKRETRHLFEALLDADSAAVRKTALESLFTSMRFVPPERVEGGLANILAEHDDEEVRISAAKALGAFGTEASVSALRSAIGVFGGGPVAAAAKAAIDRIQAR